MKNCKFCQVIDSTIESVRIFEDEKFISFLDIKPLFPGHTLLLPKNHVETIYDLSQELIPEFFMHAKKIGMAIQQATASQGSFWAINNTVSQSVAHLHLHLVPRNKGDGLKGFFWPRTKYESLNQMLEIQHKIQNYIKT